MTHMLFLILTYAALLLQVTLRQPIAIEGFSPEWLLLVSVAALTCLKRHSALFWAILPALLADCLSPDPLGVRMAMAAVVLGLWSLCFRDEARRGLPTIGLLAFGFVFFVSFLCELVVHFLTPSSGTIEALLVATSGNALYSMCVALVLAPAVRLAYAAIPWRQQTSAASENRWTMLTH